MQHCLINLGENVTGVTLESGMGANVSGTTGGVDNNTKAGNPSKTSISSNWKEASQTSLDNISKLESLGVKLNIPTKEKVEQGIKDKFTYNKDMNPSEYMKTDFWKTVGTMNPML